MELKKRSLLENIINIILNIFIVVFGIVLLISIYNSVQTRILKKSYSDFFGYSVFEVQTGSMSDTINPGDWIIVKKQRNFNLNDIVTYKSNGEFITHRIVESYNGTFVTKGDANNTKDDPIDESQIVGRVVKILYNFGIFKKTIFNPIVILIIILNILVINFVLKSDNKKVKKFNKNIKLEMPKIKIDVNGIKSKISSKVKEIKPVVKKEDPKPVINVEQETKIIEENNDELDEMEKSSQFIPVDISEIDDTLLEIANNEIKEQVVEETKKEEVKEDKIPTRVNLELFESSKIKRSKNVIDKTVKIKLEEINDIFNIIDNPSKLYVNEASIKNLLFSAYIDCRYYNYYGIEGYESLKSGPSKIEKYLKNVAVKLKEIYKGNDSKYNQKVDRILNILILVSKLENAKNSISDSKAKSEYYKKEINSYAKASGIKIDNIKDMISDITKTQRNYVGILDYFYKKLESPVFSLSLNKLKVLKNSFGVTLDHNVSFSKVYSDYIIDKTYNEGVIAEEGLMILLTMLSARISKDMLSGSFSSKYLLSIPKTLLTKEKKLEKSIKQIDDDYAKESVILLIDFQNFIKYKQLIKNQIKQGYKWAVIIDKEVTVDEKDVAVLLLSQYIFVDKKVGNAVKMLSNLSDDLMEKVICENISDKVGSFGGE